MYRYSPPYGWYLPQLFTSLKTRHCVTYCSTKKWIGLSLYINPSCRHVHLWSDNQNAQACSVNQITTVANFSTLLTYVELPQHFKRIRYYINTWVNTLADRISILFSYHQPFKKAHSNQQPSLEYSKVEEANLSSFFHKSLIKELHRNQFKICNQLNDQYIRSWIANSKTLIFDFFHMLDIFIKLRIFKLCGYAAFHFCVEFRLLNITKFSAQRL